MFKNDRQKANVCKILLRMGRLGRYWMTSDIGPHYGPTEAACTKVRFAREGNSELGMGEQILLRVAFDFWNGAGKVSVWEMMSHLDVNICRSIGELLSAASRSASEGYVAHWQLEWKGFDAITNTFKDYD